MNKVFELLLRDFLGEAFEYISNESLGHIIKLVLNIEHYIKDLGINGFDDLFKIFVSFGISMIIVKFLKKGFDMYVLWTDGDADADPVLLVTNFVRAMVVALSFTFFYSILAEIITELTDKVLNTIGLSTDINTISLVENLAGKTLFPLIGILVFVVMYIVLYITFIKNGFQIFVLRLGAPLASVGLMDADKGVFGPYVQKFFQASLTILVQVSLTKLGLALILNGNLVWAIASCSFAITTPRFLQEFLISSGGGGGITNNVYSSARLAQMFRTMVK